MSEDIRIIGNNTKTEQILNRYYLGVRKYYIEVGPDKTVLPDKFEQFYERITNFEVRDDDVFTLAFPKTGTRWTQEMVWLLLNDLNFKKAREVELEDRSPTLEMEALFEKECFSFDKAVELESQRSIKCHLPWSLLPKSIRTGEKQPKIIVIMRNPEDTCTSYYHLSTVVGKYSGSWESFCELFLDGKVVYGSFWKHLLSLWEQRHQPNIMFIKFKEMKTDLAGTIRKVAAFLGKNLSNDDVVKLSEHLSFENLKNSDGYNLKHLKQVKATGINPFMRKGNIGDHKNYMSPEILQAFEEQSKQYFTGTGITFT